MRLERIDQRLYEHDDNSACHARRVERTCPDEAELAAFLDRTLAQPRRGELEGHLDQCLACREIVGHVAATTGAEPRELGRYRLERVIGSGGMGVVWQAWDPALERKLAIKLLRPEATDDAGAARLVREARALAKLQHPNVVAIYDVGELAGEVFIATELIDGESMDRWQRRRPPRDVIAAYAQAARGLAAAHELGFVHRDVKPSNILVARDGRVRIGDFGLAIREPAPTEPGIATESRLTGDGAVVGTPAYMAPEQRAGEAVDARADQFSLCLALAEALLGARPAADSTAALLASTGISAPWSAIARGLSALPEARYPDVGPLIVALAGDRPRSRARLAIVAGVLAVAAVGGAVALRVARRDPVATCAARDPLAGAWGPVQRVAIESTFRAAQLPYAADASASAIRAIDGWAGELEAEDRRACLADDAMLPKRQACLARARGQLVALVDTLVSHPDASAIQRAGAAARALPAPSACATDAGLADQIIAPDVVTAARMDALSARVTDARTLRHFGKLADARIAAEGALAVARAAGFLPAVAEAQHELGTILHAQHDERAAEQALDDALAVAAQAHADYRAAAISALLVEIVGTKGDVTAAERQARLARSALLRVGGDRYLDGVIERGLGRASSRAAKYADAYGHFKRAEDIHAALGLSDDVDYDLRAQVTALGSIDRLDDAMRIDQRVLASDLEHFGPKHPRTIEDLSAAALLQYRAGHHAEAAAALAKVIAVDVEVSGLDSEHVASMRTQLAGIDLALGRLAEAEVLLGQSVPVLAAHLPASDSELRGQRMNLAAVQILLGHYGDAEVQLATLVDAARAEHDDESLGLVLQNLAEALARDGKPAAALAIARESIERDAKVFGPVSRRGAEAHDTLANVYVGLGDATDAAAEYRRAIDAFEHAAGKDSPELGESLVGLGELALARHDAGSARPLFERAVRVLAHEDPVDLARARFALARALPDRVAALAEAREALELYGRAGHRAAAKRAEVTTWLAARH